MNKKLVLILGLVFALVLIGAGVNAKVIAAFRQEFPEAGFPVSNAILADLI